MPGNAGTAAENASDTEAKKLARREKKRLYMAARYANNEWREAKKQSVLDHWHLLHPEARRGVRGRRRTVAVSPTHPSPEISDDAASAASTPRSALPAAAILAGAALGAAVAAML
jgi:hypothetical protein